jgi:hypothetical protein
MTDKGLIATNLRHMEEVKLAPIETIARNETMPTIILNSVFFFIITIL